MCLLPLTQRFKPDLQIKLLYNVIFLKSLLIISTSTTRVMFIKMKFEYQWPAIEEYAMNNYNPKVKSVETLSRRIHKTKLQQAVILCFITKNLEFYSQGFHRMSCILFYCHKQITRIVIWKCYWFNLSRNYKHENVANTSESN